MLNVNTISIIVMTIIAGATIWYALTTKRLWKVNEKLLQQNKRLWELSRDTGLFNYAISYLTSFVQRLKEDELREVYTATVRKTIYDVLDELLSPETANKVKKFRSIVDGQLTEKILKIKTKVEKEK